MSFAWERGSSEKSSPSNLSRRFSGRNSRTKSAMSADCRKCCRSNRMRWMASLPIEREEDISFQALGVGKQKCGRYAEKLEKAERIGAKRRMRIRDIYQPGRFGLSIEVFPPKTSDGDAA